MTWISRLYARFISPTGGVLDGGTRCGVAGGAVLLGKDVIALRQGEWDLGRYECPLYPVSRGASCHGGQGCSEWLGSGNLAFTRDSRQGSPDVAECRTQTHFHEDCAP